MQHTRVDEAHLLAAGDVVRTDPSDPSVAEVVHHSGAVTRLDPGSEAVVDRAELDGRPRIIVTLGTGRTWHHTGPFEDPTIYEARCATAVVTARFATFSVICRRDGSVDVAAVRGNVVVRGINAGSVALSDGQTVRVGADGRAAGVEPAADLDADPWVELNLALDHAPAHIAAPPPLPVPEAQADVNVDVDEQIEPPAPLPRWAGRTLAVGAAAGFIALLAVTFTSAQKGDDAAARVASDGETAAVVAVRPVSSPVAALPAGAAAMVRAAQDRSVAPEAVSPPTTAPAKVRLRAPEPVAPEPPAPTTTTAPAPVAAATATGTNCARRNGMVVYSGTLTNTSSVASGFVVDAAFLNASGTRVASGHATVSNVAPGRRASWSITVSGSSVRSCEVAGVRAV
jgi:hypothetical protein